jgi:hypothetical protein
MKVKDLISELSKLNPEVDVIVDGYEMGYNSATIISPRIYQETSDKASWKGDFELYEDISEEDRKGEPFTAVVISRYKPTGEPM